MATGGLLRTLNEKRTRVVRGVARVHREGGTAKVIRVAAILTRKGLTRPAVVARRRMVDRRLGIETSDERTARDSVIERSVHHDGLRYMTTPSRQFRKAVDALGIEDLSSYTLVDYGSGKGMMLLLAARLGFGSAVGVELDDDLVDIAKENVRAYTAETPELARSIRVVQMDAALFELPPGPVVVFMYNPFGAATLRAVLARIEDSLHRDPRPLSLIYYNPVHKTVLDESELLCQTATTSRWVQYSHVGLTGSCRHRTPMAGLGTRAGLVQRG